MMVVVVVALVLVIGVLVGGLVQTRTRVAELTTMADAQRAELASADNEVTEALTVAARAERERDDALERVQRARRDASDVAGRLSGEVERARQLERRVEELTDELAEASAALENAGHRDRDERLWRLALAATERTWRTSVALTADQVSPLAGIDMPLREAIEIEIDAAREEAGADIELRWDVAGEVDVVDAVHVLVTARELVASVAKTAARTVLTVEKTGDGLDVVIDARDDADAEMAVDIPGLASTAPGRYRAVG